MKTVPTTVRRDLVDQQVVDIIPLYNKNLLFFKWLWHSGPMGGGRFAFKEFAGAKGVIKKSKSRALAFLEMNTYDGS